ncbi:MAG: pitrilysin family protein [Alphaproteobacteria bacterium]|jgi:zinc protease|nr:pitrilysin family protein [Alphaproteobacteria bacterium]
MLRRFRSPYFIHGLIGFCLCMMMSVGAQAAPPVQSVKWRDMEAWLVSDNSLPLITMKMAWRGGTASDPSDKSGLTMLMSRLMNEGAGDLPSRAFQQAMADNAISLSFSASRDEMTGTLRCLSRYRAMCFKLLRLAVTAPRFDAEAVTRMKREQATAILRSQQNPRSIANQELMRLAFGTHAYGRIGNGTQDSLAALETSDIRAHYQAMLARDNLHLAVVGDIGRAELRRVMRDVFAPLPAHHNMPQIPAIEVQQGPQTRHIERAGPQTSIVFAQAGLGHHHPMFFADFVMNSILGGSGFSSRLTAQVREARGLAYGVYSGTSNFQKAAMWNGSVASDNATAQEAVNVIRAEMRRIAQEPVSAERLAAAKTYLTGNYALRFDSGAKIAGQLLGVQLNGWPISYFKTRNDKINAVSQADVQRAAKLLTPDRLLLVSVGGTAITLD